MKHLVLCSRNVSARHIDGQNLRRVGQK